MTLNLKQARLKKGLMIKDAAKVLGTTPTALSNYETSKRAIKPDQIIVLARLYETTPGYLLGYYSENEDRAIKSFLDTTNKLNALGMLRVAEYAEELAGNPKFQRLEAEPMVSVPNLAKSEVHGSLRRAG